MSDELETCPPNVDPNRSWSERTEANFEAKRIELGVTDDLKNIPAVTTLMLVALGESGIKSLDDLAACATDDLCGWHEDKSGMIIKHDGILVRFKVSRPECDAMILYARVKAGWIEEASSSSH
jgi:transcription termination/antitermination protein NusA